jgi:hypothetical protein
VPGYAVQNNNIPNDDVIDWNKKIHILEAFNGQYLFNGIPADNSDMPLTAGNASDATYLSPIIVTAQDFDINSFHWTVSVDHNSKTLTINWSQTQINAINQAYDILFDYIYFNLALQTRLSSLLDMVELRVDKEPLNVFIDYSKLQDHFNSQLLIDPINGLSDLMDFNHSINTFFHQLIGMVTILQLISF